MFACDNKNTKKNENKDMIRIMKFGCWILIIFFNFEQIQMEMKITDT